MFTIKGYFREYYIDNKFIGTIKCDPPSDLSEIGYNGKRKIVIEEDVILDNKRKIKSGTEVLVMIYPLNGSSNVLNN